MLERNTVNRVQDRQSMDISIAEETYMNKWKWNHMHDMKI